MTMMKGSIAAESPDAYVRALDGWRKKLVVELRKAVKAGGVEDERIKWGHIVFSSNGPVGLIRAEEKRVLFGFWRGKRLLDLEPRMTGGGKYELRTLVLEEGDAISKSLARKLVSEAVKLNLELGDPTGAAHAKGTTPAKKAATNLEAKKKSSSSKPSKGKAATEPPSKKLDPRLATLLAAFEDRGVTLGGGKKGFGENALQIEGKIFAMLSGDSLVLKLPKRRVEALVAAEKGTLFTLGKRTMSEWLVVEKGVRSVRTLAKEALEYVALV